MAIRPILLRPAARIRAAPAALLAALLAAGCSTSRTMTVAEDQETFDSATTFSRRYASASSAQACEAARRALLSQGYLIAAAKPDQVEGRKHFQPRGDVHVEIDLRIVCLPEGGSRPGAIAFVTALQDRYALKRSAISASVGVSALGSLSLPLASSEDSMVRVASRTVTAAGFYERFFALVERYLPAGEPMPPAASASAPSAGGRPDEGVDEPVDDAATPAASPTRVEPASRDAVRHATIWQSSMRATVPPPGPPAGFSSTCDTCHRLP